MDKSEKAMLESVTLSSIVIALASLGTMLGAARGVIENKLVSEQTFIYAMIVLGLITLYYAVLGIYKYHSK